MITRNTSRSKSVLTATRAALEKEFILLREQGYEYLPIHSEAELIDNLRKKLEKRTAILLLKASGDGFSASASPTTASRIKAVISRKTLNRSSSGTLMEAERYLIDKGNVHNNCSTTALQRWLEEKDENGKPYKGGNHYHYSSKAFSFYIRKKLPAYNRRIVIIFDKCHRSQISMFFTLFADKLLFCKHKARCVVVFSSCKRYPSQRFSIKFERM